MALTLEQKQKILEGYASRISRAQVMVWANYRGLTVAQISNLRKQLRGVDAEAMVVKNSLMRKALERAQLPYDHELMAGPCVVTFMYGDVAAATKAVTDFARLNEAVFQLKGGVIGRRVVKPEQIRELTQLPSREVMLARVVGGIQAPLTGLVGTLSAVLRGLLNVLNARAKQLEGAPS